MAETPTSQYVTLVSNDGYEFKLLRSAACIAGTIKKALDPMCMASPPLVEPLLNNTTANHTRQPASEKRRRTASTCPP